MPYKLSPSTLHLFEECRLCFWLQFNKGIKRPEGIFPSLPFGIDSILKKHFDLFIDKNKLPPVLQKAGVDAELFNSKELLQKWRNNKEGIMCRDSKGNTLHGAIDALLQKGDKLIILDYKTRGFPLKEDTTSHYQNQLNLYNFLFRKNNYKTEDYAYLLFYIPKEVAKNGDILFDTELIKISIDVKQAENLFQSAVKLLEGPPPKSDDCDYCKYRSY